MIEHNRYRTGTADLKTDIDTRITQLKAQAWGLERAEKYLSLLNVYRDIVGLQDAMIAIQDSALKELEHGHKYLFK